MTEIVRSLESTVLQYSFDWRYLYARRELLTLNLGPKNSLWLLFDNVDKGWPTHGIQGEDLVIIRALLKATRKLERQLRRGDFDCRTLVFLRHGARRSIGHSRTCPMISSSWTKRASTDTAQNHLPTLLPISVSTRRAES